MKKIKVIIITLTITIVSCAVLACIFYAPIIKSLNKALVKRNHTKVELISTGISNYLTENKKYPESLQQLADEKILEQKDITLEKLNIYYLKGCKPGALDQLTFYTSAYDLDFGNISNKAIVAYSGGRTEIIDKNDLDKLLAREIQKLQTEIHRTNHNP